MHEADGIIRRAYVEERAKQWEEGFCGPQAINRAVDATAKRLNIACSSVRRHIHAPIPKH